MWARTGGSGIYKVHFVLMDLGQCESPLNANVGQL